MDLEVASIPSGSYTSRKGTLFLDFLFVGSNKVRNDLYLDDWPLTQKRSRNPRPIFPRNKKRQSEWEKPLNTEFQ